MKTLSGKPFVCLSLGFVLALCFAGAAAGQGPGPVDTNRLETGGNYNIAPPPSNMMFQITDNPTNAGDDNLIWSNSGRMLAVDRSDPSVTNGSNKYIYLLDVRDLGNIQGIGARSSAATNGVFPNITGWTWNDDRVLFGWQPLGTPMGKCRLISCASGAGPIDVQSFLMTDPQGMPTNHVYSPSVLYDQFAGKERLLFLVSSAQGDMPTDASSPATRINLYTVTFDSGGVPNWNDRVQLTAFNTNLSIQSVKWCPELGTNYQPICNRLEILLSQSQGGPPVDPPAENSRIIIFNEVRSVIAGSTLPPTSLADPRLVVVETNMTMNSQVSWTFDGQYVMYGRMGTNPPPAPPSTDLYSKRADSPTNPAVKFEVPASISGGQKQWLSISPDGMKAAFTVDHKVYVIPLQFDNVAVTGAVVTNVLTDASYTAVDVPGDALPSNTVFSIVAPPSVDTNNFNGEFSGYAREFSVSGVSSQFNLATNATMTLHFSQADIPAGASATNLAIYVYNPQGTNAGQTGTWDKLNSVINTNLLTISAEAQHFSIYAIGRASTQPESNLPPAAPTSISASKGTYSNKVLIAWSASSNATSYEVWRNTSNASNSATKFATGPTVTNFDDTTAIIGPVYYYWVKAKNAAGTSGFSGSDSGYVTLVHSELAGDFDGDRLADPAVYQGTNWYIWMSSAGYAQQGPFPFGAVWATPVVGDFDGDQMADPAVYTTNSQWVVWMSSAGYSPAGPFAFSFPNATPAPADFDGDGLADPAVFLDGYWLIWMSSGGYASQGPFAFGYPSTTPVPADYDGDQRADPAVFADGYWLIWMSGGGYQPLGPLQFGIPNTLPVPGDFDGDGKADPAVVLSGSWYIWMSASGYQMAGPFIFTID